MVSIYQTIVGCAIRFLVKTASPLDRWRGAGSGLGGSVNGILVFLFLAVGSVILLAGVAWWIWSWAKSRRRSEWLAFSRRADELGLSQEERSLLFNIAIHSGLKQPDLVFSSEEALSRGLDAIKAQGSAGGQQVGMCASCPYLHSLREKLGFQPLGKGLDGTVNLGRVAVGKALWCFRPTEAESFEVSVVEHGKEGQLLISPEKQIDCRIGEVWTLRLPEAGVLWEFSAWVMGKPDGRIALKPASTLRSVNRRRFVRTSTRKPVYVADFPFHRQVRGGSTPEFVAGELLEIAGPGLLLRAAISAREDDRVLVVVQLSSARVIEAAGVVRRVDGPDGDANVFSVELTGLTVSELADLASQTNAESIEAGRSEAQLVPAEATREA